MISHDFQGTLVAIIGEWTPIMEPFVVELLIVLVFLRKESSLFVDERLDSPIAARASPG